MDTSTTNKLEESIRELAKDPDIISTVTSIENSIKTTENHYGKYYQILGQFAKNPVALYVMPKALKLAGGNAQGIESAIRVIKGY